MFIAHHNILVASLRVMFLLAFLKDMDHEVIPRLYKLCDWLLNLLWDHFGVHKGENDKVTMEFDSSLQRHILRPTLFIDKVQRVLQWERQARRDHWAKIVEQRAIKNRVQYIHCR